MKKIVRTLSLLFVIALMCGCGNTEKEVVKTCTLTSNDTVNGYKMESVYKIYGKGDVVEKVETTETVTSENEEILDYLEEYLIDTYKSINEVYGGYTNTVTNEDGKVVSTTTIDYNVMDLEKYANDNTAVKNYINSDNKFLIEGIISIYESTGAVCK